MFHKESFECFLDGPDFVFIEIVSVEREGIDAPDFSGFAFEFHVWWYIFFDSDEATYESECSDCCVVVDAGSATD